MRLFSNPYTAFLVSIQLLLLARLIWILVDEKRGGGATGSPSVRRRPAREPALTSRGFERAAPARDGSLRSSRTLEVWIEQQWLIPDRTSEEVTFSDTDVARAHLRNIELYLQRLLTESEQGRTQSTADLRNEIKVLTRTIAALAEDQPR